MPEEITYSLEANFKITGGTLSPRDLDYDIFGLHKKRTIVKGELVKVEYYRNFDGTTYSDLVVEETRAYTRQEVTKLCLYRTQVSKWLREDDTVGEEKTTIKYYSMTEAIDEGIARRKNMTAAAKLVVLGACGLANGQTFLTQVINQVNLFEAGTVQPLIDAVNNSTEPYLTVEIKTAIVNELTY